MVLLFVLLFASAYSPGLVATCTNCGWAYNTTTNASADAAASESGNAAAGKNRACTYDRCTPTCSIPSPQNCPENSNPCNCPSGTIISEEGGECVQQQKCQKYINCKGDYNATYSDCPIACPSTCASPKARYCNTQCASPGCECQYGYILSEVGGKCIKPEDCPGGKVCGKNETFVGCLIECPDLYCPVDESRVACDIGRPCPSACACKSDYLRLSVKNPTCILKSECPPGKCSRPNEEWNRCVPLCFSDTCEDRKKLRDGCPFSPLECYPRCLCKRDFYRNKRGICVPANSCPTKSQ